MLILFLCTISEIEYVTDVRKVYEFGNYLYKIGNYKSAIIEYERALFLAGNSGEIDTASIFLQIGRSYLLLGDYSAGRRYLSRIPTDTSRALIGISFLEAKCLASADSVFAQISDTTWRFNIKFHLSRLHSLEYKSPLLAGISSALVPGIGRIYSGRFWDGVFSFIFTIGSFALGYHYYGSDNRWAGYGFGVVGLFFYLGDIYGSVEAVNLYNAKIYYNEVDNLRSSLGYLY